MLFPPAKSPLRPGALLAGKYRLSHLLGKGASGVVWSAINTATSRRVALKLLLKPEPTQRERLLREARAAGSLEHPNVVDVYDVTTLEDGSPVLVLELLEGQSLQKLLDTSGPIPWEEAAAIGRDIARALAVAHKRGIIHRDLKPANVFLHGREDEGLVVKVVDFGISKNILAREGTLTDAGTTVGSPAFMSPEQVRGERNLDGRTDLWALGVILWEMLAGQRLFDGRTHEVLKQVLSAPIKPLDSLVRGIDPELSRLVHGLLQRDASARLASAEEVARRLSAIAGLPDSKPPSSLLPRSSPPGAVAVRPGAGPRDSTVKPQTMTEPNKPGSLPKVYTDDDDDDEPTHVAPSDMRRALAQKTVPKVFDDDEEDEGEATRVAADHVIAAGIAASRATHPEPKPRPDDVPTVRPPAPSAADLAEPAREPEPVAALGSDAASEPDAVPRSDSAPRSGARGDGAVREPASGKTAAKEAEAPVVEEEPASSSPVAADAVVEEEPASSSPVAADAVVASGPRKKAARTDVAPAAARDERTPFWVWATVVLILVVVAMLLFKNTS